MNLPRFGHRTWTRFLPSATMLILDLMIIWGSTATAYFLRFQGVIPDDFLGNIVPLAFIASLLFPSLFYLFRLYRQVWRYAGIDVMLKLAMAVGVGFAGMSIVDVAVTPPGEVRPAPLGTILIMSAFVFLGCAAVRSYGRIIAYMQGQSTASERRAAIIIGAGDAGSLLLRDIEQNPEAGLRVVGFIDDDPSVRGRLIRGVRVVGGLDTLADVVDEYGVSEALVAAPSASSEDRRRILDECSRVGVRVRIVPALAGSQAGVGDLRRVEIVDLLGRDQVDIDAAEISRVLEGRTVAVTGAAGSIGSELCRQVAAMRPAELHLVEIDETRLYEIYLELLELDLTVPVMHICDIRDDRKLAEIFMSEKPDMVIHAAAYKHVPLMEIAPDEAVKTNVGGTRNVVNACMRAGVSRFVLISTDKAVNPSTVMGLTKAIAERIVLDACRRGLNASAVRFGNVLGSRGSVVPLFEEQLRRGGNLKVTHPEVTRYFMTIPEAARLVLQAATISEGGEIFVLEMGEPVRIVDLARKMIVLSGADATIEFTGLRPAEKLHEVLVTQEEELVPTGRQKIDHVSSLPLPPEDLDAMLGHLGMLARINDVAGIKVYLAALMPSFAGQAAAGGIGEELEGEIALGLDSEMETLF